MPSVRVRLAVFVAVAGTTGAALLATPGAGGPATAQAASTARPVAGVHATYRAVRTLPGQLAGARHSRRYYFTGGANDQAAKLSGSPTATFSTARPTGAGQVQAGSPLSGSLGGAQGDALSIYWRAPLHATLAGPMLFHWYFSSSDALADLASFPAHLLIVADPGTPGAKILINKEVNLNVSPQAAVLNSSSVYVQGSVRKQLMIQLKPIYVDESEDLRASYGSAANQSWLDLPLGFTPLATGPTTIPVRTGQAPLQLGATYVGRDAAEPTIGVTRSGTAYFAASAFDGPGGQAARTEVLRSGDGQKWLDVSPRLANQETPPASLDPYVYVDPVTGRIFSDDLTVACSYLSYSDDGETWTSNPVTCESPVDDHQTITTGPFPAGVVKTGSYPRVVYYCVNKVADAQCARSTDGGRTFTFTGSPAFTGVDAAAGGFCGSLFGHIVTDSKGRLFMPKGHCGSPWLAMSSDGGTTWQRVQVSKVSSAGIQTAVAVDARDNLYYVWWDATDNLPYLSVSRDHGMHWSAPVEVAPPGTKAVNFPDISASGVGRIAISYPATRAPEAMGAFRPWDYVVTESLDALDPQPIFYSATANPVGDPIHRGPCLSRCAGMFDFITTLIDPLGRIWATATDTCTAESNCIHNNGPHEPSNGNGVAPSAAGLAIRELSGPESRTGRSGALVPAAVGGSSVDAGPSLASSARLPATGVSTVLPLVAAVLLTGALAARLSRRRSRWS